ADAGDAIAEAYEQCDYARAMRAIMELADQANQYVEQKAPWTLKKDPERAGELQEICTVVINLFRQLAIYLAPVLPRVAQASGELLGDPIHSWEQSKQPLVGTPVAKFQHLLQRVDEKKVNAMIEESKQDLAPTAADEQEGQDDPLVAEPLAEQITIDDFVKVDLRVAEVLEAEEVPEARKLVKLKLGLGPNETRQVFAGIKAAYSPEQLVGRKVVMVANLAPRKMKFGISEGMVVASGLGGEDVHLLSADSGAKPGQRVH
ncbi:MAG: methionine--tRNA ligase subunit beta, partial [Planctomycetota bacterium]